MTHRSSLLRRLDALPDSAPAVVDGDGTHSLRDVRAEAERALALFSDVPAAAPVALLAEPGRHWLAALIATLSSGRIAVPLSERYPKAEIARLLGDAGITYALATPSLQPLLPDEVSSRAIGELGLHPSATRIEPANTSDRNVALMLFTSGTTGRPKGVCITHGNLHHHATLLSNAWQLGPDTRLLHALPLHHMHGIAIAWLPCLLAGGTIVALQRFDAHAVWEAIADQRANTFMGVPTMYHQLLATFDEANASARSRWRAGARSLQLATSGSAALPPDLAERWEQLSGAAPLERYGMTEIGVACANPLSPAERRIGTVGTLLDTVQMRLVNDEVWIRGPSVFSHYWRDPDATSHAFTEDRWFRTGDVGVVDDDGFLRLRGRSSVDIIKSGGYKLSALEIEQVLRRHDAVDEVAVVALDDPVWGQRAVAAVVLHDSAALDADELIAWGKTQLASYKVPRTVHFVPSLPRNVVGKILKPVLAAQLQAVGPS